MTAAVETNGAPTTSAIIIFRDEARFLTEAVRSVLEQTTSDWELLLVDDGSVDGSTAQARALARGRPHQVRYVEHAGHARRGTGASRDLGLRRARGRYVAFLDADDVWMPRKLADQTELLEQTGVALLYGRVQKWHSWDPAAQEDDGLWDLGVAEDTLVPSLEAFARLVQNHHQTPTTSGSIMSRTAALAVGGFEDSFTGMYEDQALFAKLMLTTDVWVSGSCWARYRQRADSTSATDPLDYRSGRLAFLHWLRDYSASVQNASAALPVIERQMEIVRRLPSPVELKLHALARRLPPGVRTRLQAVAPRAAELRRSRIAAR